MLRLQSLRAILQSTLNHQSQVKYSCWNRVPAHNTLITLTLARLTRLRLTVGTEEAELGELWSSLVQTDVEGLALGLRVSVVTSRHLASAAEQGGRNSVQHRIVTSSNPGHPGGQRGDRGDFLLVGQPRTQHQGPHSWNRYEQSGEADTGPDLLESS